jgi:hypothetical protein
MIRLINPTGLVSLDQDVEFPKAPSFLSPPQPDLVTWGTRYFVYFPWKRVDRVLARKMGFGFSAVGAVFGGL